MTSLTFYDLSSDFRTSRLLIFDNIFDMVQSRKIFAFGNYRFAIGTNNSFSSPRLRTCRLDSRFYGFRMPFCRRFIRYVTIAAFAFMQSITVIQTSRFDNLFYIIVDMFRRTVFVASRRTVNIAIGTAADTVEIAAAGG